MLTSPLQDCSTVFGRPDYVHAAGACVCPAWRLSRDLDSTLGWRNATRSSVVHYSYAARYAILSIAQAISPKFSGKERHAQGLLYALFVFMLSWIGEYNIFIGSGALFAQTACTYAVANSYRNGGEFVLTGLQDLLRCWAMGSAVSVVSSYEILFVFCIDRDDFSS